jgi:pectinesterase
MEVFGSNLPSHLCEHIKKKKTWSSSFTVPPISNKAPFQSPCSSCGINRQPSITTFNKQQPPSIFCVTHHPHLLLPSLSLSTPTMYNLRKRSKLLFTLLPISAVVLILLSSITHLKKSPKTTDIPLIHFHKHIQVAHSTCQGTLYPDLCVSTLSSFPDLATKSVPQIISATVNHTVYEVKASASNCTGIRGKLRSLDPLQKRALDDCLELFDDTIAELQTTLSDLSPKKVAVSKNYHDLQTLLSAAMTNQYTCLDGFAYSNGNVRDIIKNSLYNISQHVSNSLVMLKKIPGVKTSMSSEVFPEYGSMRNGFPTWVSPKDRKLLQSSVNATKYDLVVAKDGTGNFTTIGEAVDVAPNSSTTRFVIQNWIQLAF